MQGAWLTAKDYGEGFVNHAMERADRITRNRETGERTFNPAEILYNDVMCGAESLMDAHDTLTDRIAARTVFVAADGVSCAGETPSLLDLLGGATLELSGVGMMAEGTSSVDMQTYEILSEMDRIQRFTLGLSQLSGSAAGSLMTVRAVGTTQTTRQAVSQASQKGPTSCRTNLKQYDAPRRVPTGDVYSAAYQMTLDPSDLGRIRAVHFNRANAPLDAALRADSRLAAQMDRMIPGVVDQVSSVGGRATPSDWVWHHATETGVVQIVPSVQHTRGSIFWNTMHPRGRGGDSMWAIPAGAPKN